MITFLVPTFNEKENIFVFINTINSLKIKVEYEFLFVDDNSLDGTRNELSNAKKQYSNVNYLIRNEKNRDLTQSIVSAISQLDKKYTFVLDCDLQHEYQKIPEIINIIMREEIDLIIGSRFINKDKNVLMNKLRIMESKLAILLSKVVGVKNIKDPMSGFFIIKTNLLTKIEKKIKTRGFKILLTLLHIYKNKIEYREVPIKFRKRKSGESKLNFRVKILFLEQILKLKLKI